ncbi:hypothetical protein GCM10023161_34770 [Mycobacterium paraffinicum]|uniref:MalT-like TPR region domain-containing protein n=1 Tax=Mycobacterium paraffinicum TaxID=53378 RepID=A0ABP8EZD4_9MYCO
MSYFGEAFLGSAYLFVGRPERYLELCRAQVRRSGDANTFGRANLAFALAVCGSADEAMAIADGLIDAAEANGNPWVLAYVLFVYGYAVRTTDPGRALAALHRSLLVARDSGNRFYETQFPYWAAGLMAEQGGPWAALDHLAVAIRSNHESGNIGMMYNALAVFAVFLNRLGRHEPASTIAGLAAVSPMAATTLPELGEMIAVLRKVLGDQTYESLARKGEVMTTADIVTYAYDQIDKIRTDFERPR